ncbi:MAG: hypothetical protein J6T01_07070, partial [Kiritimatiellae bacterium]|nr:hypothetical protein [Kiritimatiellia bacterium]
MRNWSAGAAMILGIVGGSALGAMDSGSYVQNGLVAQWDGIDNAGTGVHDPDATTWVELKGNLQTTATALTFAGGDHAHFNGVSSSGTLISGDFPAALQAISNGAFTADIRFTPVGYTQYAGLFHFGLSGSTRYFSLSEDLHSSSGGKSSFIGAFQYKRSSWDADNGYSLAVATLGQPTNVTAVAKGSRHLLYLGGELISTHKAGPLAAYPSTQFAFGRHRTDRTERANMNLYSVRLYNRALSAVEIAMNAAVDRIRFEGVDPADAGFPDGCRYNSATGDIEVRVQAAADGDFTVSLNGGAAASSATVWVAAGSAVAAACTAPSGRSFEVWLGAPSGADYTQNPMTFTAHAPVQISAQLEDPERLSADSYVKDGLIAQWDASANAGFDAGRNDVHEHDPEAWVDLSGNGQHATAYRAGSLVWTADAVEQTVRSQTYGRGGYFTFTGGAAYLAAANDMRGHTLQFCGFKATGQSGSVSGQWLGGFAGFGLNYNGAGNQLAWMFRNVTVAVGSAKTFEDSSVTVTYDGDTLRRWFGAEDAASYGVNESLMSDTTGSAGGGRIFGDGYSCAHTIHAVRVYNRPLDDFERLLNTRIDEERFLSSNATRVATVESTGGRPGEAAGCTYGAYRVAPGAAVSSSFAGSVEEFPDGVTAMPVADGERYRLLGCTVSNRVTGVTEHPGEATVSVTADHDLRIIWNWRRQFAVTYAASAGGAVSSAAASGSYFDAGAEVTLTAAPAAGCRVLAWAGDTVGAASATGAVITVAMDRARSLTALFEETAHTPASLVWQGGAAGKWSDPANWGGTIPQKGDSVTIDGEAGTSVTLDAPTAELASLTVSKTLSVTNWFSAIRADTVTVANGGVLTCAGQFGTMGDNSNRVWIVCRDLAIETGGKIDVNGRGWSADYGAMGAGPGAGALNNTGGAYGGHGGGGYITDKSDMIRAPLPYGSLTDPRDPGSAGSANFGKASTKGGNGGGAVLIEASGAVSLNGSITANSGGSVAAGSYVGGGSGGGVSIHCSTISGSGSIQAKGGTGYSHGGNGSGGRVAVNYDPAAQGAVGQPALSIDVSSPLAAAGNFRYEGMHQNGESGTVYMPDGALILTNFNINGQIYLGTKSLSVPALAINGKLAAFVQDGFRLNVAGDVVLSGGNPGLYLGGEQLVHEAWSSAGAGYFGFRRFGVSEPVEVDVGGDLVVGGTKGEVVIRAAKMTAADADPADCVPRGGLLKVNRRVTVDSGSRIVSVSHYWTGVSPAFDFGKLDLLAGGSITANLQGHYGNNIYPALPLEGDNGYAFGPGASTVNGKNYNGPGGCHFGLGGKEGATLSSNLLYDVEFHPHMAGSGGCSSGGGCHGGGVVHLDVRGLCSISGSITANGDSSAGGHTATGAGGAVWINARTLYVADTASITAKGGAGAGAGGAGGG